MKLVMRVSFTSLFRPCTKFFVPDAGKTRKLNAWNFQRHNLHITLMKSPPSRLHMRYTGWRTQSRVFGRSERPKVDFRKLNGGGTQSYLTNTNNARTNGYPSWTPPRNPASIRLVGFGPTRQVHVSFFMWDIPVCGEYKLVQIIVNHTH